MKPENRKKIPDKYKRRIENIIRKPNKVEDAFQALDKCPFCSELGDTFELFCNSCSN